MKVLILEHYQIIREYLKGLLQQFKEDVIIEETGELAEAYKKIDIFKPDLLIIDIKIGKENGFEFINLIRKNDDPTKIIVFTDSTRQSDFRLAKSMEVEGYILKDSLIEDIAYGLSVVIRGRKFYDARIETTNEITAREKLLNKLTDREIEVFKMIGKGKSNLEIGSELYISENTVKKHMTSLMDKLEVKRRTEVVIYANKLWKRKEDLA